MSADYRPFGRDHLTFTHGIIPELAGNEAGRVPIRDEADLLALGLISHNEAELPGLLAYLLLGEP